MDACCTAENVKCEEIELVAAASASDGTLGLVGTGGFWTHELCKVFDNMKAFDTVSIEILLEVVQSTINQPGYRELKNIKKIISPTIQNKLKRNVIFKRKGNVHFC